jgi:hypothetical protein
MRGQAVGVGLMALVTATACPHSFGRQGTIDRAVHRDLMDRLRVNCTENELEAFCEDPVSESCLKNCGEPAGK